MGFLVPGFGLDQSSIYKLADSLSTLSTCHSAFQIAHLFKMIE